MRYNVGDRVVVRENLRGAVRRDITPGVNSEMESLEGRVCTISFVYENSAGWVRYYLKEDEEEYVWCSEFFEPVEPIEFETASGDELINLIGGE